MSIAIKVENISKQYRLGQIGTGSLSHDVNRLWYKVRGKDDPYLKIGESNDRSKSGESNYVWSLQDISFNVNKGDAVGIIGRNGAGKSTLLKILSRVTSPTTGTVKANGRIASLLEVGTGFHPELSGRENIFLNGAILGMRKKEIERKFDEIVDFAGVERYIDTPVKRYSSGMYVRLAFAVAAHLEPEILIVDEVLAVGDAEFQKKCLGKMKDVSLNEGRTVLFVSHNLEAVQNLCAHAVLLNQGKMAAVGGVHQVIREYMQLFISSNKHVEYKMEQAPGNEHVVLLKASIMAANHQNELITVVDPIKFEFEFYYFSNELMHIDITYHLLDERGVLVYVGSTFFTYQQTFTKGKIFATCIFPPNILNEGNYTISRLLVVQNAGTIMCEFKDVLSFDIIPEQKVDGIGRFTAKEGVIKLNNVNWTFTN